ncbi:YHYH protein [Bremerella cremea]|uniref:YHYH protein n=1 Tax=Bremerella cremea TaxID=1031537 RepID=UPI001F23CADC|nr:YHYH protein [Bremerella cremea]
MQKFHFVVIGLLSVVLAAAPILAQFAPHFRQHVVNQAQALRLIPANQKTPGDNRVTIEVVGDQRIIRANGIPAHPTGAFPNRGNPNPIAAQQYVFHVPAQPQMAEHITPLRMQDFGIGINGVPFDPGAAEWYQGNPRGGWQYEALSGAVPLGIDANHAHVQPTGAYHYHGLPTDLLKSLHVQPGKHSPIVGWAADGFPIYALYGYQTANNLESEVVELKSSYRLKKGKRPSGKDSPGGTYDGTFLADYEYVAGSGDLDECNGRLAVTPEFPQGTYAYYLTNHWPVVPRGFRGTPSRDFERGPQAGGRRDRRMPPRGFGPPPRR